MVGTGIFVSPSVVLAIVGSKGLSLLLWLVGGIITWAGYGDLIVGRRPRVLGLLMHLHPRLMVYLEYGFLFPLTGGELHYVSSLHALRFLVLTVMTIRIRLTTSGFVQRCW